MRKYAARNVGALIGGLFFGLFWLLSSHFGEHDSWTTSFAWAGMGVLVMTPVYGWDAWRQRRENRMPDPTSLIAQKVRD